MKIIRILLSLAVLISTLSCTKEVTTPTATSNDCQTNYRFPKTRSDEIENLEDIIFNLSAEDLATDYYEKVAALSYYTNALCLGENAAYNPENPFSHKLANLNIVDENDNPISFFSMTETERMTFFDHLIQWEKTVMTEKVADIPEYIDDVYLEDLAMTCVMDSYGIPLHQTNDIEIEEGEGSLGNPHLPLSGGDLIEEDDDVIPDEETCVIIEMLSDTLRYYQNRNNSGNIVSLLSSWKTGNTVPTNNVLNAWKGYARRGDIVLSLPVHNVPWIYLNLFNDNMVGHAGVFTETITNSTSTNDYVTVEAWTGDGVVRKTVTGWDMKHYILGIRNVTHKIIWRGFHTRFETIYTPVSNPSLLATQAESQLGKNYVTALEFPFAKFAAPARFTCTSLVWWCAKECYNLDVSSRISPLVSPSAIYTNSHIYVRKSITQ